jgi:hypothetical protein
VALTYFERMRNADLSVVDLFTEDAELCGLGRRVQGKDEVRRQYEGLQNESRPRPRPGLVLSQGDRVLAELKVELGDGRTTHVVDLFELRDGKIARLTYFIADYPDTPQQAE